MGEFMEVLVAENRCKNLRRVDCDECCVNRSEIAEVRAKRNGEDYIYPSYREKNADSQGYER